MATVIELGREYEAKVGEFQEFIKAHSNGTGDLSQLDLSAEGALIEFNQRNEELGKKHAAWMAAKRAQEAAADSLKATNELRKVNRGGIFTSVAGDGQIDYMASQALGLGDRFLETAEYKAHSGKKPDEVGQWAAELEFDQLSNLKATLTTTAAALPYPDLRPGVVPYATRRPVIRDLLPVSQTDNKFVAYIRQNTQTFGADTVPEGGTKPETTLGTERVSTELQTIAHYIKVTNQALDFIPGVRDMLNQQGVLGLQLAEEDQILNGSGVSPDLTGFLNTSGVQTQAVGSDDQFTAFHNAWTKITSTVGFANVTGGAIHPLDWSRIITLKDANGRFIYGDPFQATQAARIWGIPLIVTPAMTEGTALIGDFLMYARLWLSGGVRVIVGYVNDDLIKNQQTIVIEEYAALEISRPTAFCTITGLNS